MERIKLKQNYWALAGIIIVAILLVIVVLEIKKRELRNSNPMNEVECLSDADCIKQATGCCGCSMGGNDICVSKQNASIIQENMGNCSGVMCLAVYNCRETSCSCIQGKCVEE
ncbi:MAG: hypothetical protein NT076_04510 [Candidatus Pacearchaeota archaeon]|nr:hypothetical protein [Candidatus Pacearchaeota archaeon]